MVVRQQWKCSTTYTTTTGNFPEPARDGPDSFTGDFSSLSCMIRACGFQYMVVGHVLVDQILVTDLT